MLRVGLVTTEFFQCWGGIASYCINLCRALGDEVEFYIISTSVKGTQGPDDPSGTISIDRTKYLAITSRVNGTLSTLKFQFALAHQLPGLVKDSKLDLVHSAGPLADNLVRILGSCKVPLVLTYHSTLFGQRHAISNVNFRKLHRSEQMTRILYPLMKIYESAGLSRTKNIIAVSKAVRNDLIDNYKYQGKMTVIHNGIDTNMFQPGESKALKKKIIYSGRLISLKGLETLIEAAPAIIKENADVVFSFTGTGQKDYYRNLLLKTGVPESSFEFQQLSYSQMPDLYRSGEILVLPSFSESFPMSILEAMASGLPVVASDVGDVPELVIDGQTGFKITPGDSAALAEKINLLLASSQLRERIGRTGRDFVEKNFSTAIMGQKTLEVYRSVQS